MGIPGPERPAQAEEPGKVAAGGRRPIRLSRMTRDEPQTGTAPVVAAGGRREGRVVLDERAGGAPRTAGSTDRERGGPAGSRRRPCGRRPGRRRRSPEARCGEHVARWRRAGISGETPYACARCTTRRARTARARPRGQPGQPPVGQRRGHEQSGGGRTDRRLRGTKIGWPRATRRGHPTGTSEPDEWQAVGRARGAGRWRRARSSGTVSSVSSPVTAVAAKVGSGRPRRATGAPATAPRLDGRGTQNS